MNYSFHEYIHTYIHTYIGILLLPLLSSDWSKLADRGCGPDGSHTQHRRVTKLDAPGRVLRGWVTILRDDAAPRSIRLLAPPAFGLSLNGCDAMPSCIAYIQGLYFRVAALLGYPARGVTADITRLLTTVPS
ncbi:hypothetical protein B296_00000551 [Ensete ventricosum]|uniref:Uncharacterized protein n=1 Tax=Ensete ventricosum TaxID=4639 RepID=A0A427AGZ7_ENSVE|nr:hypothetical protein B296_00000551 [Ensete ventricosum]